MHFDVEKDLKNKVLKIDVKRTIRADDAENIKEAQLENDFGNVQVQTGGLFVGYATESEGTTLSPRNFFKVCIQYTEAAQLINDLVFYGIDREDKHNKINKFLNMAEQFHYKYVTDTYEDASGSKSTQQEEPKIKQKTST